MKKIGIITIIDNDNYGNRLQNYALQEKVKSIGCTIETIINLPQTNEKNKFILRFIKNILNMNTYSKNKKRANCFKEFNNNINFTIGLKTIYSKLKKYEKVIVGSDQVWNPNFGRLRDMDLLSNIAPDKRISYAASFAVEEVKKTQKLYQEFNKFKAISVREENGKKIIEKITDRKDIEVVIDPTMLLTEDDWNKIIKKPKQLSEKKYILNYFLGNLSNEIEKEIEKYAASNNCKVINILDKENDFFETGPSEFLYLEKNAYLICTDSFHSSVFAMLFNRPFIIFERTGKENEKMNSRLETLINKFKLKNRKYEGKITEENLKHDYTEAYKILEVERKKSEKFLKSALDIKD